MPFQVSNNFLFQRVANKADFFLSINFHSPHPCGSLLQLNELLLYSLQHDKRGHFFSNYHTPISFQFSLVKLIVHYRYSCQFQMIYWGFTLNSLKNDCSTVLFYRQHFSGSKLVISISAITCFGSHICVASELTLN
jgi:hypothetical protein